MPSDLQLRDALLSIEIEIFPDTFQKRKQYWLRCLLTFYEKEQQCRGLVTDMKRFFKQRCGKCSHY
jgi:hypothetical protein